MVHLYNGKRESPLIKTRDTAGLDLDPALPVRVSVSPEWVMRFEQGNGALGTQVDARARTGGLGAPRSPPFLCEFLWVASRQWMSRWSPYNHGLDEQQ